jgi:hypothetical protein
MPVQIMNSITLNSNNIVNNVKVSMFMQLLIEILGNNIGMNNAKRIFLV